MPERRRLQGGWLREWQLRGDVVGRALKMITDGEVERSGVAGIAARLGYSTRHLTRLITEEIGAGQLALARAQRAHTARTLLVNTPMPVSEIAWGFGSGYHGRSADDATSLGYANESWTGSPVVDRLSSSPQVRSMA